MSIFTEKSTDGSTFTDKLKARLKPKFSHRKNADVIDAMVEVIDRLWHGKPVQHVLYKLEQVVNSPVGFTQEQEEERTKKLLAEHQERMKRGSVSAANE